MEKTFVYDPLDDSIEEFENIEDAKKWILENYICKDDGVHPDIESILIKSI